MRGVYIDPPELRGAGRHKVVDLSGFSTRSF